MKSFNSNMADDNYNTSQSNLVTDHQQQQQQHQQQLNQQLQQQQPHEAPDGIDQHHYQQQQQQLHQPHEASRSRQILDEMSQDLQYLSREAPLDGGESTFGGAYSQLGGTAHSSRQRLESEEPLDYQTNQANQDEHQQEQHQQQQQQQQSRWSPVFDQHGNELSQNQQQQLLQQQQQQEQQLITSHYVSNDAALEQLAPDNVDIQRPLQQAGFLVSFMVDARGGAMRGCRHSGVRVIIPPNTAPMPMRITCRYLRRERLVHPPPLMEGEACASKIMEVGPAGAKFLGPVLIEVPHFASLRGQEREIIILRSDSGEVWREHLAEADEQLVESIIKSAEAVQKHGADADRPDSRLDEQDENKAPSGGGGGGGGGYDNNSKSTSTTTTTTTTQKRLTRIVTSEFPQYFAIISRIRQEVHTVGPDGSTVDSQLVPRVQAVFTEGALTKRIKIGLQKNKRNQEQDDQTAADQRPQSPGSGSQEQPDGARPQSAASQHSKRRSRFLACFGSGRGSLDLLDQSAGTSDDQQSSSSAGGGGHSPKQARNATSGDEEDSDETTTGQSSPGSLGSTHRHLGGGGGGGGRKRRQADLQLVPEDYYIEREPPLILNMEPATYGKRLASSSAQTDQKLGQANGFMSISTRKDNKKSSHRPAVLGGGKRRRNKAQLTIHCEPSADEWQQMQRQQQQQSTTTATNDQQQQAGAVVDSSLELELEPIPESIFHVNSPPQSKWRTCTIQTDSDSVTVNYVTLHSADDRAAAAAAEAEVEAATQTMGGHQDDGYVSGSGDLKHRRSGLFSPFCASSTGTDKDSEGDSSSLDDMVRSEVEAAGGDTKRARRQRAKAKAKAASAKKNKDRKAVSEPKEVTGGEQVAAKSASAVATKLKQPLVSSQTQQDEQQHLKSIGDVELAPIEPPAAGQAAGEDEEPADESLTSTTTRSMSPTSKELKLKLKQEKQERKRLDDEAAKAAKASKKAEKEAKKKQEKLEKAQKALAKRTGSQSSTEKPDSPEPAGSRAQSPVGGGGATLPKVGQSVKFAADEPDVSLINTSSTQQVGGDPNLASLTSEMSTTSGGGEPTKTSETGELKPILKQQSISFDSTSNEPTTSIASVATKLVKEATEEALRSSGDSSVSIDSPPTTDNSASSSSDKSKAAKLERARLKREAKERAKESKQLAKETEAIIKAAEAEAERACKVAESEARKAADEARKAQEQARKAAASEVQLVAGRILDRVEATHGEAQKSAKDAKKAADVEAKKMKAEADKLAKDAKKYLKLEKKKLKAQVEDGSATAAAAIESEQPGVQVDVELPSGSVNLAEEDDKDKKVAEGGASVHLEGPSASISMPKFKLPKFGLGGRSNSGDKDAGEKADDVEHSTSAAADAVAGADVKLASGDAVEAEAGSVKVDSPKGTGFSMPKLPDIDIKLPKLKKNKKDKKTDGEGELKSSSEDDSPSKEPKSGDAEASVSGSIHMPKFKMPKFGFKGKSTSGSVESPSKVEASAELPEAEVVRIEAPQVDLDIEAPAGKIEAQVDVEAKAPEVDASLIDIEGKTIEVEGPSASISMPKFKMPKFGLKGKSKEVDVGSPEKTQLEASSSVEMPDASAEVKPVEVDVEMSPKKVEVEGPSGSIHMPKFKMPKFGLKGKASSGSVESPSKGETSVGLPEGQQVEAPPQVDVDASLSPEFKKSKFKMPRFGFKAKSSDAELSPKSQQIAELEAPQVEVHAEVPEVDVKLDAEGNKVELEADIDVKPPEVDVQAKKIEVEGPSGSIHMPKFKMPKFGLKGKSGRVDSPDSSPSKEAATGLAEAEVKAPEGDVVEGKRIEVESPKASITMPKFRMPKFGSSDKSDSSSSSPDKKSKNKKQKREVEAAIELPTASLEVDAPQIEGVDVEVKAPEVDIEVSPKNVGQLEGPSGSIHLPKFKMPKFGLKGNKSSSGESPSKAGEEASAELSAEGQAEVDSENLSPEAKKVQLGGSLHMPKFKMPKFGLKHSDNKQTVELESPEKPQLEAQLPEGEAMAIEGELNVEAPSIEVNKEIPQLEGASASSLSMPKFKMPKFGLKGKSDSGQPDVSLESPKATAASIDEGQVIEGPTGEVEVDANLSPESKKVQLEASSGGSGSITMPKFKLPKFGLKGKSSDVEVSPKSKDIGQVEGSSPQVEAAAEVDADGNKIELEAPKVSVSSSSSKFKLPRFGFGGKSADADVELDTESESKSAKKTKSKKTKSKKDDKKVGAGSSSDEPQELSVSVELPAVSTEAKEMQLQEASSASVSLPKVDVKMPKLKGKKAKKAAAAAAAAGDLSVSQSDVDPKSTGSDEADDKTVEQEPSSSSFSLPKFRLPKFGSGSSSSASTKKSKKSEPTVELPSAALGETGVELQTPTAPPEVVVEAKAPESVEAEVPAEVDSKSKKEKSKEKKTKKSKKSKSKKATTEGGDEISREESSFETDAPTTSKSSGFFKRLFGSKAAHKAAEATPKPEVESVVESKQTGAKLDTQPMIVSEMYPSDPNNADGEMILEVNVPQNLISRSPGGGGGGGGGGPPPAMDTKRQFSLPRGDAAEISQASVVGATTTTITTPTTTTAATNELDQEATLVNVSQLADEDNDNLNDNDDEDATENVISQTNELGQEAAGVEASSPQSIKSDLGATAAATDMTQTHSEHAQHFEGPLSGVAIPAESIGGVDVSSVPRALEVHQPPEAAVDDSNVTSTAAAAASDLKDEKKRKELEVKLEKEAKRQAKEDEKLRVKREKEAKKAAEVEAKARAKFEAQEAKRLAELAKKQSKEDKKKAKEEAKRLKKLGLHKATGASAGTSATKEAVSAGESAHQEALPKAVEVKKTTTTIEEPNEAGEMTKTVTVTTSTSDGDGHAGDGAELDLDLSQMTPINESTETQRLVEEVVGEDGTVTKRTKVIETKFVTLRQEELRMAERRDIPVEEWQRMQAAGEQLHQQQQRSRSSSSSGDRIEIAVQRVDSRASGPLTGGRVENKELEEIIATPSYFGPQLKASDLLEAQDDGGKKMAKSLKKMKELSPKKELRMRFKLNKKLIKRAQMVAKTELKRARGDAHQAKCQIGVAEEAARSARKELKRALKESKRAMKEAQKDHKRMDKVDKKLAKQAKKIEKRQRKIDKRLAKVAKKAAKKREKLIKSGKISDVVGSGMSAGASGSLKGSKKSIKVEDIGEPVLRSSSRLSVGGGGPSVVASTTGAATIQEESIGGRHSPASGSDDIQVDMSLDEANKQHQSNGQPEMEYHITTTVIDEAADGSGRVTTERHLDGREAAEAAMRMELEAARNEEEEIDVVGVWPSPSESARAELHQVDSELQPVASAAARREPELS